MHATLERYRTTSERLARARRERREVGAWEEIGRRDSEDDFQRMVEAMINGGPVHVVTQ